MLVLSQDEDRRVLAVLGLGQDEAGRVGEGHGLGPLDLAGQNLAAAGLGDRLVQGLVQPHIAVEVACGHRPRPHQGVDLGQDVVHGPQPEVLHAALGGPARGQALKGAADLDGVEGVLLAEGLHRIAAAGQGLQEALLLQPRQGRTHRRARHAQAVHRPDLGHALAGRQLAGEQQFAHGQQGPHRLRRAPRFPVLDIVQNPHPSRSRADLSL